MESIFVSVDLWVKFIFTIFFCGCFFWDIWQPMFCEYEDFALGTFISWTIDGRKWPFYVLMVCVKELVQVQDIELTWEVLFIKVCYRPIPASLYLLISDVLFLMFKSKWPQKPVIDPMIYWHKITEIYIFPIKIICVCNTQYFIPECFLYKNKLC